MDRAPLSPPQLLARGRPPDAAACSGLQRPAVDPRREMAIGCCGRQLRPAAALAAAAAPAPRAACATDCCWLNAAAADDLCMPHMHSHHLLPCRRRIAEAARADAAWRRRTALAAAAAAATSSRSRSSSSRSCSNTSNRGKLIAVQRPPCGSGRSECLVHQQAGCAQPAAFAPFISCAARRDGVGHPVPAR